MRIVDATEEEHAADAAALLFEYLKVTMAELGRPVPTTLSELRPDAREECLDPLSRYPPPSALLIAYEDQRPAGCVGVTVRPCEETAAISRLFVRPEHRGGVGAALMHHAHRHAAERGITRVTLDVMRSRHGAISLYRKLGYTECATPTRLMRMSLRLAS